MNRLCLALLLTVATASLASNVELEDPAPQVVNEPEDSEFDKNEFPMDTMDTMPESRQDLNVGTIGATDRLMARTTHRVAASNFVTHDEEITIRGVNYARITSIRINRVGNSQNGRPTIRAGGLGFNFVTLSFLGNRGQGYEYTIDIHSATGC